MDLEVSSELNRLKLDEYNKQQEIKREVNRLAFLLKGEMGKDIHDVLEGRVKVELSWKEKLKYKCNYFINKLFSIF